MKNKLNQTMLFMIITFLWTWSFYFAIIRFGLNPYQGAGMVLLICGGCAPTFAGVLMVLFTYDRQGKIDFFRRVNQPGRIKPAWWAVLLLTFPVIFAATIGLDVALGGSLPGMVNLKAVHTNPPVFIPLILLSFLSGPFSEELGWRGFALDPLINRFGFVRASVLLGIVWGVWHLPLYWMPQTWHGQMGFAFSGFWAFVLFSVGLSLMMSWVYVHTKHSILAAMLMHLFSNFTGQMLDPLSNQAVLIKGLMIFAIGLVLAGYVFRTKKDKLYSNQTKGVLTYA